jgi:hypothetical protein
MGAIDTYHQAIDAIVGVFGATHATMHVHAGLAIYLLVQLAVRTRRGSMTALNVVFLAEMANEGMGRLYRGYWDWPDTLADIVLTMMWPIAITAVSQYRRARWARMRRRAERYGAAAGELLGAGLGLGEDAVPGMHWAGEGRATRAQFHSASSRVPSRDR